MGKSHKAVLDALNSRKTFFEFPNRSFGDFRCQRPIFFKFYRDFPVSLVILLVVLLRVARFFLSESGAIMFNLVAQL